MKWAAGIFAAILYLVSPYYALLELAQAIRAADAQAINRLVDWDELRPNLKRQLQAQLQSTPKSDFERENPGLAAAGNAFALTIVNSLIDSVLTPEGIVRLVQSRGDVVRPLQQTRSEARPPKADTDRLTNLWQRTRFAFFISPIHFRLDLSEPDGGGAAVGTPPPLTVMLTFKWTGWQVTDLRLPKFENLSSKVALAPN